MSDSSDQSAVQEVIFSQFSWYAIQLLDYLVIGELVIVKVVEQLYYFVSLRYASFSQYKVFKIDYIFLLHH